MDFDPEQPPQLVCDKCGHFDWETLADKLERAMLKHRLTTLWVPPAVFAYMKNLAEVRFQAMDIPSIQDVRKLLYRGVEVKSVAHYEPLPCPHDRGEMYLIVNRDGSFLYMWVE